MTNVMIRPNRMSRDVDNWFNTMFNFPRSRQEEQGCDFTPRVNVKESDDNIRLLFEVPGMDKKDIKVTVKDDVLTVSGERKAFEVGEKERAIRDEILTGTFSRSFTLPETIDTEKITADYRAGMLEVTLAKKEAVKPKEIEVSVA